MPDHGRGRYPQPWALRHAGPWSRKISATSKAGRDTRALASAGRPDLLELERDMLQRAHDLADRLGGDAGIERRGVEFGVTEQYLDDHALAVDVGDLERDHLSRAQAGTIGHAQRCLVLEPGRG